MASYYRMLRYGFDRSCVVNDPWNIADFTAEFKNMLKFTHSQPSLDRLGYLEKLLYKNGYKM